MLVDLFMWELNNSPSLGVLNPVSLDAGAWHVRMAWDASTAQISRYHHDR